MSGGGSRAACASASIERSPGSVARGGRPPTMTEASRSLPPASASRAAPAAPLGTAGPAAPSFEEIYASCFDFVWRSARRLGVHEGAIDDVVQDVFLVLHRRAADFEGRSSLRTWAFSVLLRVVSEHRRTQRRKSPGHRAGAGEPVDPDALADRGSGPHEKAVRAEARSVLSELLDELSDERRAIFVLVELEEMSVVDAAEAVSANVNTAHARLRAAREDFEAAVKRRKARDERATREARRRP